MMIPAGYMAKRVIDKPAWIKSTAPARICSVSNCMSRDFADYIHHWKQNGFWLFDRPALIDEIAAAEAADMTGTRTFYYEVHDQEFDEHSRQWTTIAPEAGMPVNVEAPANKRLLGYDVVTFYTRSSPEHSPLSCNAVADDVAVNADCLLPSLERAIELLQSGAFENCEPGPYRIFAVYALQED